MCTPKLKAITIRRVLVGGVRQGNIDWDPVCRSYRRGSCYINEPDVGQSGGLRYLHFSWIRRPRGQTWSRNLASALMEMNWQRKKITIAHTCQGLSACRIRPECGVEKRSEARWNCMSSEHRQSWVLHILSGRRNRVVAMEFPMAFPTLLQDLYLHYL